MESFTSWLKSEIKKQGWNDAELSRQLGISRSAVSVIFSGRREPTWNLCMKIANVLNKPPIFVFRMARLLPSVSQDQQMEEMRTLTIAEQKMVEIIQSLQSDDREMVSKILDLLAYTATEKDREIWDAFCSLQADDREAVAEMIDTLVKKQGGQEQE